MLIAAFAAIVAQDPPMPRAVNPAPRPSDAVVLDHSRWRTRDGGPNKCKDESGVMVCATGAGDIFSVDKFRSAQLHLEFNLPPMPDQKGQRRANSGFYLHGRYELQILDGIDNPTYANGTIGALYNQAPPLVSAAKPAGEWQTYDVIFHAPKCDANGAIVERPVVTALLNGVLVQDRVAISEAADQERRRDQGKGACEPGPIKLQDHSGFPNAPHTVMKFRNIWFRPLD
ncbi:MAG: DUF1080 domain-containing protein [Bryobacteraceae bacterium]|nr:DUF1080 domain-containing protein [Bryobacteraceae bacterium]